MATENSNRSAGVEVELEAMRKDDFSWHPCKVSLYSIGVGLVIEYLKNGSSEIIVNREEALERIRIRSIPFEGDDCSLIQQGDHILANRSAHHETLLLDAKVDKALSVRHSNKVRPRCTFVVKWIKNQVGGETATVPCNAMRKVSSKSINFHPTIFAFFNILGSSICFSIPTMPTVADGKDCEFDISELGKQIEKISNSADATVIKNSEPEQFWQGHDQSRMLRQMEVKDPHQEFSQSKPLPNPIAARAALASMMSKLYHSSEVSPVQIEAKEFGPSKASNGTTPYCTSAVTNFIKKSGDHSSGTKSGKQKHVIVIKELFPNGKAATEAKDLTSHRVPWNKREKEKNPQEYSEVAATACISKQSKSSKDVLMPSSKAKRLTRSAIRELEGKEADETKIHSAIAETKTIARQKQDLLAGREIVLCLVQGENEVAYSFNNRNRVDRRGICGSDGCRASISSRDLRVTGDSRRLTRSSVHGAAEKDYETSGKGSEIDRSSRCVNSNIKEISAEGKVTASIDTPKPGDDATCITMGSQDRKRKSTTLKKQELRFSPRLRSLAQTRSQNKS